MLAQNIEQTFKGKNVHQHKFDEEKFIQSYESCLNKILLQIKKYSKQYTQLMGSYKKMGSVLERTAKKYEQYARISDD